jgi:predicted Ser/Thr protein kinase
VTSAPEIFADACDLPADARAAFLDRACAGDQALRREVEALLDHDPGPEPAVPAAIGRFKIERAIGEGGMGRVYAAVDPTLGRTVAIKRVRAGGDAIARARLLREAQSLARMTHPNVVAVHEVGVDGGDVFLAMEYVEGRTLAAWLSEDRATSEILAVFLDAGRGLAAAHAVGLLHRDFKPENVLVGDDGRVRVVDFGLARAPAVAKPGALEVGALTDDGALLGTPGYMSPEQLEAGEIGPWSDQWVYAAALYRALYRQAPFTGATFVEHRARVLEGALRPPPTSDVPADVEAAILRALARDRRARFASIEELLDVITSALAVHPNADAMRFARQRRRALALVLGLTAVSFVAAAVRTSFRFDLSLGGVIVQGLFGLAFLTLGALVFRKTVLSTGHHRRLFAFLALPLIGATFHRLYGLWQGASVEDVLRIDALFAIVTLTLGAIAVERWLARGALLMGAFLVVSFVLPALTTVGFGITMLGVLAIAVMSWPAPVTGGATKPARGG